MTKTITIGLFGTCGGSKWRDRFMAAYASNGIDYFNPQVEEWTPEMADIEAQHLVEDDIIFFPVTGETAGMGSLAETGFSMFQAMKTNMNRYFVFMVDPACDPNADIDPLLAKESRRARALVLAHLRKNLHPNVFLCGDLDQMLEVSLRLHRSLVYVNRARELLNNGGRYHGHHRGQGTAGDAPLYLPQLRQHHRIHVERDHHAVGVGLRRGSRADPRAQLSRMRPRHPGEVPLAWAGDARTVPRGRPAPRSCSPSG